MTFSIRTTHHGRHTWLDQGDKIGVEFPDGKGVSARIADVVIASGGSAFSLVCTRDGHWPDARPETPTDAFEDADGSNDPTPGERDLLNALRMKSQQAENLKRKVEELRNELDFRTRREGEKDRILASRTRQLERSRRLHEVRNERIAELERALQTRHRDVEDLRATLKDLGNDYQLVREQLEQEKEQHHHTEKARETWETNSRNWEAQYQTLSEMTQKPKQQVNRLSGSTINPGSINFYGEASTQQVLAARERLRQRVVTQHDGDGSVTIRVELSDGSH